MTEADAYRTIADASPDAILVHRRGRIVYANPAAAALLGATGPDDLLGMDAAELVHPDDRGAVAQQMSEEQRRRLPMLEQRLVRRDGSGIEVEVVGTPLTFAGETATQILVRDVSERRRMESRLRDAESRYRALVESLPAIMYVEEVRYDGQTLYISPQVEQILGLSQFEYLANPTYWESHLHPEDREPTIAAYRRWTESAEPGDQIVLRYRLRSDDGEVTWLQDTSVLIESAEGDRLIQGVMFDVTEQQEAADALLARDQVLSSVGLSAQLLLRAVDWREVAERMLRAIGVAVNATHVSIWENVLDEDGAPSSRLTHLWSAPDAHAIDPIGTEVPMDGSWADWTRAMESGIPVGGPTRLRPPEELEWFRVRGMHSILDVPVFVEGAWWGVIGFDTLDEREWSDAEVDALQASAETLAAAVQREQTEQQLRTTEGRYRALVEQIPAVLYIDRPGTEDETTYISPQVEEILGLSAEAWVREADLWLRHLHPDDREHALLTYRRGVAAGNPFSYEYRMLTPRGLIWIRDDAVVLRDEAGTLVQGVMFDVTEQKLAEEALLESEGRERQAAERLRALDQMKNTFLAAVSHELRSPLTTVLGLAVTLEQQHLPSAEQDDLLHRLAANAKKLERLLADLLDIDRLSRGAITAQRHTSDVTELVRRTVEAADFLGDRTVEVEAADTVVATIDAPKVERIVENLLVNAARHTPPGTTVWVQVEPALDGVRIAVADDGPGIPDDLKDAIFDPFRQGPSFSPHTPGTGIGLTLVREFVALHGGRVWVEDRPGGGAVFRVLLPEGDAHGGSHAEAAPLH